MRLSTTILIAGAAAMAASSAVVSAAPVRAATALPGKVAVSAARPMRAATRVDQPSQLIGFPIAAFAALFGTLTIVAVVTSGRSRSPG